MLLICLAGAMNVIGQQPARRSVGSQKPFDSKTDFKQPGAPMPPLKLLAYYGTPPITDTTKTADKTETSAATGDEPKSRKKRHKKQNEADANTEKAIVKKEEKKKFLTNSDFDDGANLLVMMFNPTCSHCEDETELLEKNIFYFKKTKLLLIANPVMVPYLPNFAQSFHIGEYPSIYLGTDSSNFISQVFLYQALPQLNIYDGKRKLIKTFAGEVPIDSLKNYIQ